jgi:F-box and WD-40 domain protein 7
MKNNLVVSGSSDSTLKLFNIIIDKDSHGRKIILSTGNSKTLEGHESDVYCLDFNDDFIVSSGADSKVLVWNFSGKLLHQLVGHLGVVRYMFIDNFKLVTGGDAKKIMVWDYKVSYFAKKFQKISILLL